MSMVLQLWLGFCLVEGHRIGDHCSAGQMCCWEVLFGNVILCWCCFRVAMGDRSRDSSAKEIVSSIFHAANKRIRRSRDKSSGRSRESGERDGTLSEPTSYSERNIDQEVELRQLQELLRTGGTGEPVDEEDPQSEAAAASLNSSVISSASSAASADATDILAATSADKTSDSPTRKECRGAAILRERRTYFLQNGCNQLAMAEQGGEQKRHSVDVTQSAADCAPFPETVGSTSTSRDPPMTSSLPEPVDISVTSPSSRAAKMQQAVEQQMQQLADDLQRTFNATSALPPPSGSSQLGSEPRQDTVSARPPVLPSSDAATRIPADSQSVTSDYSTMSSVCGGQDECRRNRQVCGGNLDVSAAPTSFDTRKVTDRSTLGRRRNRNFEVPPALSTPRSQSSGNFSLANSDPVDLSVCAAASALELSQDSIDSAADRSDLLSLSLSSQMSDSDNALLPAGVAAEKHYVEPNTLDSALRSDAGLRERQAPGATITDSETDFALDQADCSMSSEREDQCGLSKSSLATLPVSPDQVTTSGRKEACSDSPKAGQVMHLVDSANKQTSVRDSKEPFPPSQHPVHRLVRRHTLGGTGDLAVHVVDLNSPALSSQPVSSRDEQRPSAWQRLQPAVQDPLPNFGTWLTTQRQLYHARSSPALFVGVALTSASCLHTPSLNCQSVV